MHKKIISFFSLPIIFITLLLFLFTILVPPFQKPDEPVHFYWTMALMNGTFQCKSDAISDYFPISESVYAFPAKMQWNTIIMRSDAKFPIGVLKQYYPFLGDKTRSERSSYCSLPILPYIPQVVGGLLSYPFNNLLITFYMMRLSTALFFLGILILSYRIVPDQYKKLFLWYASIPMVLHQASALSYDGVSLSLMLLLVALFLSCLLKKNVRIIHVVAVSTLFVLSFLSKSGYIGFLILPLILLFRLPWITQKKGIGIKIMIGVLLGIGLLSLTPLKDIIFQSAASYQHQFILKDPYYFIHVLARTLWEDQGALITGLFGTFGWLEYGLPMGIMAGYMIAGTYVVYDLYLKDKKMFSLTESVVILVCVIGNIIILFYHFYIYETPPAYKIIFGFQGRYVLPLLPLFLVAGIQFFLGIGRTLSKRIIIGGISIICIATVGSVIFVRYYDFSKNFSNPDELKNAVEKNLLDTTMLGEIPIEGNEQFVYEVKNPNYKIGGFQMLIANEQSVSVPYRYMMKDSSCKHVLRTGYLDTIVNASKKFLRREKEIVYTQYVPITKLPDTSLCLTFTPVFPPKPGSDLVLLGNMKPLITFLYIAQ